MLKYPQLVIVEELGPEVIQPLFIVDDWMESLALLPRHPVFGQGHQPLDVGVVTKVPDSGNQKRFDQCLLTGYCC